MPESDISALRDTPGPRATPEASSNAEKRRRLRQALADLDAQEYGEDAGTQLTAKSITYITTEERKAFREDHVGYCEPNMAPYTPRSTYVLQKGVYYYQTVRLFTQQVRQFTHIRPHSPIQEYLPRLLRGDAEKWWRTLRYQDTIKFLTASNGVELFCKALEKHFALTGTRAREMRASVTYDMDSVLRGDSFRGYVHDLQLAVEAERGYVDQAETCQLIYDQLAPDLRLGMISRPLKSVGIEEFVQECVRWQDDWVTIANRKRNKAKKTTHGTAKALAHLLASWGSRALQLPSSNI